MKFLASDDQFIADLPSHDEKEDFRSFDIIQDAEVSDAQLEFG
jgi:hypothetical protein